MVGKMPYGGGGKPVEVLTLKDGINPGMAFDQSGNFCCHGATLQKLRQKTYKPDATKTQRKP
jgi:hypothetical protein